MFAFDTKEGIALNELGFFLQDRVDTISGEYVFAAIECVKEGIDLNPNYMHQNEVVMAMVNTVLQNDDYTVADEKIWALNIPERLKLYSIDIIERIDNLEEIDDIIETAYQTEECMLSNIKIIVNKFGGISKFKEMISFVLSIKNKDYQQISKELAENYDR